MAQCFREMIKSWRVQAPHPSLSRRHLTRGGYMYHPYEGLGQASVQQKETWDSCLAFSGVRLLWSAPCMGDCDLVLGVLFWNCCFPQSFQRRKFTLLCLLRTLYICLDVPASPYPTLRMDLEGKKLGIGRGTWQKNSAT